MDSCANILIVDDLDENLMLMELIVNRLNVNIIKADSGSSALEQTLGLDLALAILDIRMPVMNGFELAKKLNESRGEEIVPIIFITANSIHEIELHKGYDNGAVDFIVKPFERHYLVSKIKVFLNLYYQRLRTNEDAIEIKRSSDELLRLHGALKISEEKYRSYIDNAPDAVFVADNEGQFVDVNVAACRTTGYSKEELLQKSFNDLFFEGNIETDHWLNNNSTIGIAKADLEIRKKDGTKRWWTLEGVRLANNKLLYFTKDITQRKEAENLLIQMRLNYEVFFNTINDFLFALDEQGMILHTNTTAIERLGYPREELIGASVLKVHPSDRQEEVTRIFAEMLEGKTDFCPIPLVTHQGIQILVETMVSKGYWDGKPAIFWVSKDISKLKLSEEKFSKVFYINPSACSLTETDTGKYIEVNNAFSSLLGFSQAEVFGRTPTELGIVSSHVIEEMMNKSAEIGSLNNIETDLTTKNGDIKHVLLSAETIVVQNKKYRYTAVHDITKRKQTEAAIKESEQKYRMLIENLNEGIWYLDKEAITTFINPRMAEILGYKEEEMIGMHLFEFMDSDGIELASANLAKRSKGIKENHDFTFIHKSGNQIVASLETAQLLDADGNYLGSVAAVQNITERRKEQEEIRMTNTFLDSIVENIPDMIFIKDANTLNFIRLNQAGQELLGITNKEIIGKNDFDFFPIDQATSYTEYDKNVILNNEPIDIAEEYILTRNKGLRILHTRKVPILNTKGEPEYLLGISRDITEMKLAEQSIKITEDKYKTILNSSPDGIILIDLKGLIMEVSEMGLELFGPASRDDIVGKRFFQFVPSVEKKTIREIIFKTLNEGLAQNIELKVCKKNQSIVVTETSVTLIQDQKGKPISFMVIIRDISHRRLMETKQFHADRMANLGQMAAGIAHEINQPLNIISMVMDKVLFQATNTSVLDYSFIKVKSDKIFENITRIRNIIDHIRDFSRSDNNYLSSDFDINTSIENASSMITEQYKHLGIRLKLNLEKSIPPIVGNTYKFEQVIVNLLNNAKDAVLAKKIKLENDFDMVVEIKSYSKLQALVVEVSDNGIGISKDDINNILLPFYTTKEEGKGTGLGLSICYQIIKEMDGTIKISSDGINGAMIQLTIRVNY